MIDYKELHNFEYLNHYELEAGNDTEVLIELDGKLFEIEDISIEDGKLVLVAGENL